MDKVIDDGEEKAKAISEQYDQGFINDNERHRLTVRKLD